MLDGKYLSQDAPEDPKYPFAQISLQIPSGGFNLNAILEQTTGKGPHPTILLLHGFPGNEKNIDMSQALKRVGFNVLLFHYKGAWGSPGNYNFSSCIDDTESVINFLLDKDNADKYRIDRTKISIIGHSLGGFLGLKVINQFEKIKNMVAISPVDFKVLAEQIPEDHESQKEWSMWMEGLLHPLRGTKRMYLVYEMLENKDNWDLKEIVSRLKGKNLYFLAGSRDEDIPPSTHFEPIINLNFDFIEHKVLETEHQYSNCRIELISSVYTWLSDKN